MYPDEKGAGEEQPVEKTAEEIAAEEREAEKAFAQGFDNVRGGVETKAPAKAEGEGDDKTDAHAADEKAKAESEAAAKATADAKALEDAKQEEARVAAEKEWDGISPGVRKRIEALGSVPAAIEKLAGHVGGFKRTIDSITATAKAAAEKVDAPAPTKVEIEEALLDPAKWTQLQTDFPEWMGPVAAEFARVRKDMKTAIEGVQANIPKAVAHEPPPKQEPIDTTKIVAEAEERAYVRFKHPDWKQICASPDFVTMDAQGKYTGGWLSKQGADIQAKASSDSADDAVAIFDAYKAHKATLAAAAAEQAKKTQRLERAAPPKGRAEPPSQGISDEEAFERGFKRAKGQK